MKPEARQYLKQADKAVEPSKQGSLLGKAAAVVLTALILKYAPLAKVNEANATMMTTDTHWEDTQNGINVYSQTYLDPGDSTVRMFNYLITNSSGDTLFEAKYTGEGWLGGQGRFQPWLIEIFDSPTLNQDFIRFYGNSLYSGQNEELITGSSFLDSWAVDNLHFKTDGGEFDVKGLVPYVPEPATIALLSLGVSLLRKITPK